MWKFSIRIAVVAIACLFLTAQAGAQTPRFAPANPDFERWQAEGAKVLETEGGHTLGYIPPPMDWSFLKPVEEGGPKAAPPASYDLRTLNALTPVRDQGQCGCCWTFGTYASLESWLQKNGDTRDFSENNLKNYSGFLNGVCGGGNADMSTAYLARWSGPVAESADPYHAYDDRPSPGGPAQKYVQTVEHIVGSAQIKNRIMSHGALYTAFFVDETHYYNPTTHTYYYSGSNDTNHAVAIAGWDDNKVVPGAPGNGAWLIRNSWGSSWGEGGYFWLSYYDSHAGDQVYSFWNAVPPTTYARVYSYDDFGITGSFGYGAGQPGWGANVFTAAENGTLNAVAFYAASTNVSYEIKVFGHFNGSSFSNQLGSTVTGSLTNAGYYTISLTPTIPITSGSQFSVVVKFTTPDSDYSIPIEAPASGYAPATASAGQSYCSGSGTTFQDITTMEPNTNICIKALTLGAAPSTFSFAHTPLGGWFAVGESVRLAVTVQNATGPVSYQWMKNGAPIAGATTATFAINSVVLTDTGYYTCQATDTSKTIIETPRILVSVFPAGSLPVAGLAALALATAACMGIGVARIRRRRMR